MQSQNEVLLNALKAGKRVTNENAIALCGTYRLSGRIFDLRQMGYNIVGVWRDGKNRFGHKSRYMEYHLEE